MKPTMLLLLMLLWLDSPIQAGSRPSLRFNQDGTFKIVQFTDTHINLVSKSNLKSLEIIQTVVKTEMPDLVVLTGDIITEDDPKKGYQLLSALFQKTNTPWAVVFGNHESEGRFTRKALEALVESLPGCLNHKVSGITGNSNFILQVKGQHRVEALLYCFDSNSYSALKPIVDGYGWFDSSQMNWYRSKSAWFTKRNEGRPLPALAFFHIPLPEYTLAFNQKNNISYGARNEEECCPAINSGMFTAMLECGDVMGSFVGHDHVNDYIVCYHQIALAYGRVSKIMKNVEDPLAGGRVILIKQGRRAFDTWIREYSGKKVLSCSYPSSFVNQ